MAARVPDADKSAASPEGRKSHREVLAFESGPPDGQAAAQLLINGRRADKLPELDLSGLGLDNIPGGVRTLPWLRRLVLQRNRLQDLPEWIGELGSLQSLDLGQNPLKRLPKSLRRLRALTQLSLEGCKQLPDNAFVSLPAGLSELSLAHMDLVRVSDSIGEMRGLQTLHLHGNHLEAVPDWIGALSGLEYLNLEENRLTALPESLRHLPSLSYLRLGESSGLTIPAEIAESNDARRILGYYFRLTMSEARTPLNEFKLILVGRGGVGKTSLVHRMAKNSYREFARTPGISVTKWSLKIDGDAVRAHIWDFGGQEIMHGTHRFFMTARALYLVLVSGREGTEDRDAEYWLSLVRSFAGDPPIIVLLHKWDDYRFELNRQLLREKYGKNLVFVETDSSTGYGIPALRQHVCSLASKLPGIHAPWPAEWWTVKHELPGQRKSWLSFDDFRSFCRTRKVTDSKDQDELAECLHDLGLMLSYRKDDTLRDFGVLNPQWVTEGIYAMLNSLALRDAGGRFTVESFGEVLSANAYPEQLHPYLLALMRKFQLCHPLDDRLERHLIPELLTKEEPELDPVLLSRECLCFAYRYGSVLPEGLLPRFIVDTYVHREPKVVWRTGVVLERANCRALIRADVQGRTVTIRVAGPAAGGRRELLGIIREYFERIHRSYERLPVEELVPIPGHPDATVPHELLLTYEAARRPTITVQVKNELRDYGVRALLDGVDLPELIRRQKTMATRRTSTGPLSLFISYSHKDSVFLDQLRGAIVPYERKGELTVWADPLIEPGQEWESEIFAKLDRARMVILLLSNDFLSSYYCMDKELKRAVRRHAKGECEIVPVVVRACRFDKLDLGKIQAIIPEGKPIQEHADRDRAWHEVTRQIDRVIARLAKAPP